MLQRTVPLNRPFSLRQTLGPLRRGRNDPCVRFDDAGFWRTTRTVEGPATLRLVEGRSCIEASAWGPGAGLALEGVPELIGEHQDDARFATDHPVVHDLHHRHPGLRIPRTGAVFEAVLPSIIEQRVTGLEAKLSYARIVRTYGEPAPGPAAERGLFVSPCPEVLAATPSWALHRFGLERKRAQAISVAAGYAARLQEAASMEPLAARKRLTAVPGIGPWTAAEVAIVALGDADSVTVGDYHLHDWVAWALAGEARGDDRRMLQLLEPFRGQRGRVLRLIAVGHSKPPKFGPRYSPLPIASM